MSASSGLKGFCEVCEHANNEHRKWKCTAKGCKKKWMVCQTGAGHQEWGMKGGNATEYVVCVRCDDHLYNCEIDVSDYKYIGS